MEQHNTSVPEPDVAETTVPREPDSAAAWHTTQSHSVHVLLSPYGSHPHYLQQRLADLHVFLKTIKQICLYYYT